MRRIAWALAPLFACGACEGRGAQIPDTAVLAPVKLPDAPVEIDPATQTDDRDVLPMEVAIGDSQLCLRLDGRVRCGNGDDKEKPLASQPALEGIEGAIGIALAGSFGCAVTRAGHVYCWGNNAMGELGAGLRDESAEKPVRAKGVEKARRIFAAGQHACAVLEGGELQCWGDNTRGQTGSTTAYERNAHELATPALVPGMKGVLFGAATDGATCVSTQGKQEKEVWCWGESVFSDQQDANGEVNEHPWRVPKVSGIEQLAAGDRAFCGIKGGASAELLCWGESYSLFADYRGKTREPKPLKVPEPKRVRLAQSHACALAGDSRVYCWGSAYTGALGREIEESKQGATLTPEPVPDLRAVDIAVGGSMSCAVTRESELYCWGRWPWSSTGQRMEKLPVAIRVR